MSFLPHIRPENSFDIDAPILAAFGGIYTDFGTGFSKASFFGQPKIVSLDQVKGATVYDKCNECETGSHVNDFPMYI